MTGNSGRSASAIRSVDPAAQASGRKDVNSGSATRPYRPFLWPRHDADIRLTLSIVICTRYRPEPLRECLEHISRLTLPADEVIVVDNSSGDEETKQLAEMFGARYVLETTLGLSRARNTGLAESRCDLVAYLDDDCIPDAHWLEYLRRPFYDEQVASVTGEIIRFTGEMGQSTEVESALGEMRYVSRNTPRWFEIASFGGVGSGGNMAFRKRACSSPALFDERLGRGAPLRIAEENCAFASLLANGHSIVRFPMARVYHPEKSKDVEEEATSTIAYWLLLFTSFAENRVDLLHFLLRRILRRRLTWRLEDPQPSVIMSSGWALKLRAVFAGVALFFRARKYTPDQK
jgi:glycosyltransferase involved in cell wall biosynthesis